MPKTTALIILDGWGHNPDSHGNAIAQTPTPCWDRLWRTMPHRLLTTHGAAVGLPDEQMGNSEVGHLHLGAGRIMPQSLTRINQAVADGTLARHPLMQQLGTQLQNNGRALHFVGLLSAGGVHSHQEHLFALYRAAYANGLRRIFFHLITDGRDTAPRCAQSSLDALQSLLITLPGGRIATLSGRYFAMDRDRRWDRVAIAWRAMVQQQAEYSAPDAWTALANAYARDEGDEFVTPTTIAGGAGISLGDVVICTNFRADRMRQLGQAFSNPSFPHFARTVHISGKNLYTLCDYGAQIAAQVFFPPLSITNDFGAVLASAGKTQLRLAETEKYPHVTYFFSGGKEEKYPGESRILIPSPKVATYDLQPEMGAMQICEQLVSALDDGNDDVIICNFANGDMVGHTGDFVATCAAVATLDRCLVRIVTALERNDAQALILADHGNCEQMYFGDSEEPQTAHTTFPVPMVYVGAQKRHCDDQPAGLADVAPTLLRLIDLPQPSEMTGRVLVDR